MFENKGAIEMPNNVAKFPKDKIKRKQPQAPDVTNIHELGMSDGLSPQELLAVLSRDPNIENILIIIPETHEDADGVMYQDVEVLSAGDDMDNANVNWLADKVKAKILGYEV